MHQNSAFTLQNNHRTFVFVAFILPFARADVNLEAGLLFGKLDYNFSGFLRLFFEGAGASKMELHKRDNHICFI